MSRPQPSCWHPFGCQAPGDGCVGRCPVTPEEAARIERDAFATATQHREPRSTVELLTYAAAWFDDLDRITAAFTQATGGQFEVKREIQDDLLALARWMTEHSDANDEAFAYVQRNALRTPQS